MSTTAVDITILGRPFKVGSPSDKVDELRQTAHLLNTKLEELQSKTRIKNLEHLAVMAALNFCHELSQERQKTTEYNTSVDERITLLQETIERALADNQNKTALVAEIDTDTVLNSDTESSIV